MRRAVKHLNELNSEFKRFREGQFYEIRTQVDLQTGMKCAYFYPTAHLPLDWPAILGELLYDMRSSLDHAVNLLTKRHNPAALDRHAAFPIALTESAFEGTGPKDNRSGLYRIRGIPDEARELITRIQPYKVQGPHRPEDTTLAVFDELANTDKHRALNLCRMRTKDLKAVPEGGVITLSSLFVILPGKLEEGAMLTCWEPGSDLDYQVEMDIKVDFWIALDEGGPKVAGREVVGVAKECGALVKSIITKLREIYDRT